MILMQAVDGSASISTHRGLKSSDLPSFISRLFFHVTAVTKESSGHTSTCCFCSAWILQVHKQVVSVTYLKFSIKHLLIISLQGMPLCVVLTPIPLWSAPVVGSCNNCLQKGMVLCHQLIQKPSLSKRTPNTTANGNISLTSRKLS